MTSQLTELYKGSPKRLCHTDLVLYEGSIRHVQLKKENPRPTLELNSVRNVQIHSGVPINSALTSNSLSV